jgi:nucleoside phosphorylase
MMNTFLFITANSHERIAFESKFVRKEEKYILGKTYYLGTFGSYPVAYIHMGEQGVTSPASTPLVGQLISKLKPVAVVMVTPITGSFLTQM